MARILLIEDTELNQKMVKSCLNHHEVMVAPDLKTARSVLSDSFDLILLDVQLPDGDGFSFFIELQPLISESHVQVIFLTGRTGVNDKVTGYSMGADDYITKPIDPIEFRARVDAKIRKIDSQKNNKNLFKKDGFVFSMEKQTVTREESLKPLNLTTLEFKLFLFMVKHKDHVLSREKLIEAVWGENINISDRTIDSHISHLRKHLTDSPLSIQAVYGSGYKLTSSSKAA